MICYFLQLLTYFPGLIKRKYQLRTHFSLLVQSSQESWSTSFAMLQRSETTLLEKSWNLQLPFPTFTTKTFHSKFQFFFFSTCVDDKISKSLMKEVVGGNLVGKNITSWKGKGLISRSISNWLFGLSMKSCSLLKHGNFLFNYSTVLHIYTCKVCYIWKSTVCWPISAW